MRRPNVSAFFAGSEHPAAQILPPPGNGLQVVLVAIPREPPQSGWPESPALHRVHVAVLPPEEAGQLESPLALLPPLHELIMRSTLAHSLPLDRGYGPRLVRGEILWSSAGRFYEKVGRQIVPLRSLAAGPRGEVLEVAVPDGPGSEETIPAEVEWGGTSAASAETRQTDEPIAVPRANRDAEPAGYRQLLPGSGQRCVVRFGDFRGVLHSQVAHPERLRDSHLLACFAQVYEALQPQRLESLAAALAGSVGRAVHLLPLNPEIVVKLGLARALQRWPQPRQYRQRIAGVLLPGERVVQMELIQDPTAAIRASASPEPNLAVEKLQPAAASDGVPSPTPPSPPLAGPKTSIPDAYLKPWDFKFSRDEALYELNREAAAHGLLHSLWRNLKRWLSGRAEFRRWQTLLNGKSPENQLWTVRPPQHWMTHPVMRDWARRTLEWAGYDAAAMLSEWEIFWRRKGL